MPKKLETDEEIREAWKRKQERDRKAQAKWVDANRDEHKRRMREQYQKRKANQVKPIEIEPEPVVEKCAVKEVPAGLSLLDVIKRIRNSYYASMRNKAGWRKKSEEAREQWKADFVFCDDLISKNDALLTAEHKTELTTRGITITDPRLIAKELDETIFIIKPKRKLRIG